MATSRYTQQRKHRLVFIGLRVECSVLGVPGASKEHIEAL